MIIWVRKIFFNSSSVYSCHLFLISSASLRSLPFLSFIEPFFARNIPWVSLIFLEEISSLSHSVVFLYFFALIAEEGFRISPCYSLELWIQMGITFLFSFAFHFSSFPSYLWGLPSTAILPFAFLFLGSGLGCLPAVTSQASARNPSGTLSIRPNLESTVTSTV